MAWEEEHLRLLRADLQRHQKLTREQLEATREMRDVTQTLNESIVKLTTSTDRLTQMFAMVLSEMRTMRETLSSIVSPAPMHANGNGG